MDDLRSTPIDNFQIKRVKQTTFTHGEDNVTFKLLDSSSKATLELPVKVRIIEENKELFKLCFLYMPGKAPRSGDNHVNTAIFEKQTFVLVTGTDEKTGKVLGKKFSDLACIGFSYYTVFGEEQRYEQVTCLSSEPRDWENLKMNIKTLGIPVKP